MAQDDPPENPDKSTEWAEVRTDLAEDRNIMAMERTFAGWMRTSFAAIGIGLGFKAVFGAFDPPWLAKAIATMFILAGGWLAITAERRACHTLDKLQTHKFEAISTPNFRALAYAVAAGSHRAYRGALGAERRCHLRIARPPESAAVGWQIGVDLGRFAVFVLIVVVVVLAAIGRHVDPARAFHVAHVVDRGLR